MNEIKSAKIHMLMTCLSPLTHMSGTAGNEALINRHTVMRDGQLYDVPVISGNSLRHILIREPGADYLYSACQLYGDLNVNQAWFMYNGGSLTESTITDNLKKIAEMQEILPLYRLLGGSLSNQVLAGSIYVGFGRLFCEEEREYLEKLLPHDLSELPTKMRSCEDYIGKYQYTRTDIQRMRQLATTNEESEKAEKANLMIYGGQTVIPGAVFYTSFTFKNISRLELGAWTAAVRDWHECSGTIGGMSRIGHGQMDFVFTVQGKDFSGKHLDTENFDDLEDMYREHVYKNEDAIKRWLSETFPATAKKEPKSKTTKTRATKAKPAQLDFFAGVDGDE